MSKPLIVGLDPGLTTAIAILDLKGDLIVKNSKKRFKRNEIIDFISSYGKPLIISTDKKIIPKRIEKIASLYNCKIIAPEKDLTIKEKNKLVKIKTNNKHERDALASAINALKYFYPIFSKIDSVLYSLKLENNDKVKELILTKKAKNIAEAINMLKPKKERIEIRETVETPINIEELKERLKSIKNSYNILKEYTEKLERRIRILEEQKKKLLEEELKKSDKVRKELLSNKEISIRDGLIKHLKIELNKERAERKRLEKEFEKIRELQEINSDSLLPVIIIKNFEKNEVYSAEKEFGLNNKILYFENYLPSKSAVKALLSLQPKIIIGIETNNILEKAGIIVLNGIKPKYYNYYGAIKREMVNSAIENQKTKGFLNWLKAYKNRKFY